MNLIERQREFEIHELRKSYDEILEKRKAGLAHRASLIVDDVIELEKAFVEWGEEVVASGKVTKTVFRLMLLPASSVAYIVYRTLLENVGNISYDTAVLAIAKVIGKRIYHEVLFSKLIEKEIERTKKTQSVVVKKIVAKAHKFIKAFKHKRAYSIQGLYSKQLNYIHKELMKIGTSWDHKAKRDVGLLALYIATKAMPHRISIFPVYKQGSKGILKAIGFNLDYINAILEKDIHTIYLMYGSERLMVCTPKDWCTTREGLIPYGKEKEFFRYYCLSRKGCSDIGDNDQV